MILTNALLSIALSITADFTNVVAIPGELVPRTVEDLREYYVGIYGSPDAARLVHRSGAAFTIYNGVIDTFESPRSLIGQQDPTKLPEYLGKPMMSSNEVLELATRTITSLARGTNPIANVQPLVKSGRKAQGKEIPFYEITWPRPTYRPGFGYYAGIEIDARNGQITRIELHDPSFCNYERAARIREQVYTPDPPSAAPKVVEKRIYPNPETNQVERAIVNWLSFCAQLKIAPGSATNFADVNWDRTFVFTNDWLAGKPAECVIEFTNGVSFCSVQGIALSHTASDAFFHAFRENGTPEQLRQYVGTVNISWEEAARNLERILVETAGISKTLLASYAPQPGSEPPEPGAKAIKRVLVEWINRDDKKTYGFGAEFDLETGEVKKIGFRDQKLIEAVGRAQAAFK